MLEDRKPEEFESDIKKWKVYFDFGDTFGKDSCVDVRLSLSKSHLTQEDIEELKQDLKDFGKLRIITTDNHFKSFKESIII